MTTNQGITTDLRVRTSVDETPVQCEQHFHVMLYKVLTLNSVPKPYCATIQMKAIEQYFHGVLFIMLYKVVLTLESVNETLLYDDLNRSY